MRAIIMGISYFGLSFAFGCGSSEENYYYAHIADRETGIYESGGIVYFQVKVARSENHDEESWRCRSLLSIRRQMVDWVTRHAPVEGALSEDLRRVDVLNRRFYADASSIIPAVHVAGRSFSAETTNSISYAFAAARADLMREASKGVPGKTSADVLARWKQICSEMSSKGRIRELLAGIGCDSMNVVSEEVAERGRLEFHFLDGWNADSCPARLLLARDAIDVAVETPWLSGLQVIADLKQGRLKYGEAAQCLYAALDETPGSVALWCHLGCCFMERKLYALAILAYKNALCLSSPDMLTSVLASSASNLAHAYKMLKDDTTAARYVILTLGFR